ncbi:hypothetical protein QQY66_01515 [Streptomyces sp. DG2A-72]|uniref:hypothetical protein n=1 Tax=Streptomyces sp. DG2A-72 TaxID=3051386 RepID=UPI00265C4093|nr:hypothetical protein [Streptomyces sp. DG2A-72]MDO0930440.1 hypothetical protein [Streptomyces sp. DG2A-72]
MHWTEARAVVARIAANPALAAQLWLAAARFPTSEPRPNNPDHRPEVPGAMDSRLLRRGIPAVPVKSRPSERS